MPSRLGEFREMNGPQSRVARGHRREYLARSISRAIIDDDDFHLRVILMQEGLQRFFDVALFVSRRDDDGNLRPHALRDGSMSFNFFVCRLPITTSRPNVI